MKKVITLLAIIMIIVMGFALIKGQHTSSKNNQHRQITIVASTDFYAELAQTVVGSHGKATAIIKNQNISPEDYEPTTAVAKEVSQADIVLANGLGYDTWLNKLAKASDQAKLIRVGETVLKQKTGSNPHLWNNPETMIKTAHYLAKHLGCFLVVSRRIYLRVYYVPNEINSKHAVATFIFIKVTIHGDAQGLELLYKFQFLVSEIRIAQLFCRTTIIHRQHRLVLLARE